jgi:adenylate kinase
MTGSVVALVGLSGVGKTTFLKKLGEITIFQHLSAGTLIARARSLDLDQRDSLRSRSVDDNQRLLVSGFMSVPNPGASLVVIDGHAIIHTPTGVERVSPSVFGAIGVSGMMHLSAMPEEIYRNRMGDSLRARPPLSLTEIDEQQRLSLAAAKAVCETLKVPFLDISATDHQDASDFIERVSADWQPAPE